MQIAAKQRFWSFIPEKFSFCLNDGQVKGFFKRENKFMHYITIIGFDQYLLKFKGNSVTPTGICQFNFDVKFSLSYGNNNECKMITLINQNSIENSLSSDEETLLRWIVFLQKKINQTGFDQHFKVYKKIGEGNYASVYWAKRKMDNLQVAVKVILKSSFAQKNGKVDKNTFLKIYFQEAIINEIECMRKVDHSTLIKLFQVYESENSIYLIMELQKGGSLLDLINNNQRLKADEITIIMFQIFKGLRHMHKRNIMHRDLKLENILFKRNEGLDLIIGDFGLATDALVKPFLFNRCGTPGFVAPEVLNIIDQRTTYKSICDLYSTGIIFHILLTKKNVFNASSYSSVVRQNKEAKVDFSQKIYENLPSQALDLLMRLLQKNPNQRISAVQALEHKYFEGSQISTDRQLSSNQENQVDLVQSQSQFSQQKKKIHLQSPPNFKQNDKDQTTIKFKTPTIQDSSPFTNTLSPQQISNFLLDSPISNNETNSKKLSIQNSPQNKSKFANLQNNLLLSPQLINKKFSQKLPPLVKVSKLEIQEMPLMKKQEVKKITNILFDYL